MQPGRASNARRRAVWRSMFLLIKEFLGSVVVIRT
jgi:hypothetical protein